MIILLASGKSTFIVALEFIRDVRKIKANAVYGKAALNMVNTTNLAAHEM